MRAPPFCGKRRLTGRAAFPKLYVQRRFDTSACGRLRNTAKAKRNPLWQSHAGFFVPLLFALVQAYRFRCRACVHDSLRTHRLDELGREVVGNTGLSLQQSFATQAVRAGQHRTQEGEHNEPIFVTSSFVFDSAAQAAARFSGDDPGNVYSRFTNPSVRTFEERLAALEGGARCVAMASGMSAIASLCLSTLKTGESIVAGDSLFGSTMSLFNKVLSRFQINTTFVPANSLDAWQAAIGPTTRMLFVETPTNPLGDIVDLAALSEIARRNDCLLVVDNCVCTPALQRPLEHGADVVIHSATKYLDGQGRCVGGAVVLRDEALGDDVFSLLRTAGPCMSPFNAWVFAKGLETLSLRMRAHCETALALAEWLEGHPGVARVYYPGLASHPQYSLARSQQDAFGGVVAFEVHGAREEAWRVIDASNLFSITANFGDAKSTITHPASTTHARLSAAERERAGVNEGLLRVSAGLESFEDIRRDLALGLDLLIPATTRAAAHVGG